MYCRSADERACDRRLARLRRDDQLREHRIVEDRDVAVFGDAGVDADAGPSGSRYISSGPACGRNPLDGSSA